ncbi:MAG: hypothetical protein R2831_10220 [Chitinophagaceae bacterium]
MKKFVLFFSFLLACIMMYAGLKKISGNPAAIANETTLNVQFTYNNMRVGKFPKEEDYVKTKKEEYNKKEEGRGEKWEDSWVSDRSGRFEPQFTELFEKHCKLALGNYPEAKYTAIIHTTRTEPGYNIYISRKNAEIDLDIDIIETQSKTSIVKYSLKGVQGRSFGGYDYDSGTRLEEAYALAGKLLGKELSKTIK